MVGLNDLGGTLSFKQNDSMILCTKIITDTFPLVKDKDSLSISAQAVHAIV